MLGFTGGAIVVGANVGHSNIDILMLIINSELQMGL